VEEPGGAALKGTCACIPAIMLKDVHRFHLARVAARWLSYVWYLALAEHSYCTMDIRNFRVKAYITQMA